MTRWGAQPLTGTWLGLIQNAQNQAGMRCPVRVCATLLKLIGPGAEAKLL